MNDPDAALRHQGAYVAVAQLIINVPADRTLAAVAEKIIPQPDRSEAAKIPFVPWVDEKLYEHKRDEYRYEGVRLRSYSEVEDSILFPDVTVGRHARVCRGIIDAGVEIHEGFTIGYDTGGDRKRFTVTEKGRVVVTSADLNCVKCERPPSAKPDE